MPCSALSLCAGTKSPNPKILMFEAESKFEINNLEWWKI